MRPLSSVVLAALVMALTPAVSLAATTATTSRTTVLHGGPAARFPRLTEIPRDEKVSVKLCNASRRWCEIDYKGKDGWVRARHLEIVTTLSQPVEQDRRIPTVDVTAPAAAPTSVDTAKGLPASQMVTITIKSADGKVSSKMTVAAGSSVVVTASGRSRCELKVAVNP